MSIRRVGHGKRQRGFEPADFARTGEGVVVNEVMPQSPAAEAGVQEGDVIVRFNGTAVREPRELQELVERTKVGERRTVTVLRDGKERKLDLVVKALPQTKALTHSDQDAAAWSRGLSVQAHPSSAAPAA